MMVVLINLVQSLTVVCYFIGTRVFSQHGTDGPWNWKHIKPGHLQQGFDRAAKCCFRKQWVNPWKQSSTKVHFLCWSLCIALSSLSRLSNHPFRPSIHHLFMCWVLMDGHCYVWTWLVECSSVLVSLFHAFSLDCFHGSVTHNTRRFTHNIVKGNDLFGVISQESCEYFVRVSAVRP